VRDCAVHWSDSDQPVSDYTGIDDHFFNGRLLILRKPDREFIINMNDVRLVTIRYQKGK
jgi:hypothetical protein